jgi:hypothetical protein
VAVTQPRAFGAFTGSRYSSFAGKSGSGPHPAGLLTQSRTFGAFTGRRYGSFAGRGGGGAHPVDAITQPRAFGAFTGRRYGSFAGRDAPASNHPVGRITQPRAYGALTGRRYGSFAGRVASVPPTGPVGGIGRPDTRRARRIKLPDDFTAEHEDELLTMILVSLAAITGSNQ